MPSGLVQWLKFCGYGVLVVAALFGLTGGFGLYDPAIAAIVGVGAILGSAAYIGSRISAGRTSVGSSEGP